MRFLSQQYQIDIRDEIMNFLTPSSLHSGIMTSLGYCGNTQGTEDSRGDNLDYSGLTLKLSKWLQQIQRMPSNIPVHKSAAKGAVIV